MTVYDIDSVANLSMSVNPEGFTYNFEFRYFRDMTYVTIRDASDNIISGPMKVTNEQWLIPFPAYNYTGAGNFMVIDIEGHYPVYWRFSNKCKLVYYTAAEIENGL